jgi:hypothetical protein
MKDDQDLEQCQSDVPFIIKWLAIEVVATVVGLTIWNWIFN